MTVSIAMDLNVDDLLQISLLGWHSNRRKLSCYLVPIVSPHQNWR